MSDNGFFRAVRSQVSEEINKDPNALSLLYLIARRARWHDGPNLHNLKIGEALVGDYKKGLRFTRKEYRCALDRLERQWLQITTRRSYVSLNLAAILTERDRATVTRAVRGLESYDGPKGAKLYRFRHLLALVARGAL